MRSKDPNRDIKAKKTLFFNLANLTNGYIRQFGQVTTQPNKKNSRLY